MLQEIIDLQNNAVEEIIGQLNIKSNITFKAPTGSGKTHMMADFMDRILGDNEDIIFLVSSLSKGELAEQNHNKFVQYVENKEFFNINPLLISSDTGEESRLFIPTDYNVYVLPRDLYKNKSKLKQGALINFLDEMTKVQNKKVYLIKDECHIATSNLDSLSDKYFTKTLNCSATPKLKKTQKPDVEINEVDAINSKLIKKVEYGKETDTLEDALNKFKEIKKKYEKAAEDKSFGKIVKPCIIIQISNKDKADEEIEEIQTLLKKTKFQDLQWMLIVDNEKKCDTNNVIKKLPFDKWKEEVKKPQSTIDIIIFKMVITEGWDIPRACMLYQMRDSKSKQLDEQVIGRVRRNPKLLEYENLSKASKELVTTSYVWGIVDKATQNIKVVKLANNDIKKEIRIKTTRLKDVSQNNIVDVEKIVENKNSPLVPLSIFDLYSKYLKIPEEIKKLGNNYINNTSSWYKFTNNIDEIVKESKNNLCNYQNSMELNIDDKGIPIEVTLPSISYYFDNGNYRNIGNWLWQRVDENEEFSFDSEAEKEWCEILLDLISEDAPDTYKGRIIKNINTSDSTNKKYLLGKNYLPNSEIKFEYYLYGKHMSYPDFIMKDFKNRIHLYESKSLNKAIASNINDEEYKEKVNALKECYKAASILTGYYFYIPIKKDNKWDIIKIFNGDIETLSKREFINFIKK